MMLFHPVNPFTASKAWIAVAACLLLTACGSGSGDTAPIVNVDDVTQLGVASTGILNDDNNEARLFFAINEDDSLDGFFVDPSIDSNLEAGGVDVVLDDSNSEFDAAGGQYTILSLPEFGLLQLRAQGTVFHYEPQINFSGSDSFVYAGPSGRNVIVDIMVNPVADAPVLNRDINPVANQGRRYQVQLQGFDADGDVLTYTANNLPRWLLLDSASGVLTGVPGQEDVGAVEGIRLSVTDSTGLSDVIEELELEVVDINDVPILNLTQAPRELFGRDKINFNVFPRDVENDLVEITVEPNDVLTLSVTGSQINVEVEDIGSVQSTELIVAARDERGALTRESIAIDLYPRTESNKGTTLVGHKQGRGVHIVVLGDGYASDELRTYRQHVESVLSNIRSDAGISEHLGAFNIHMIETVSQQSGSDDSDLDDRVSTAFDSAYNCQTIPRLVCADVLKLYEVALAEYPEMDQIILLVNDSRYGGSGNSGGRVAITSAFYPEIALHEMGHSLADLADEYIDPLILDVSGVLPFEEGRFKNVSNLSNPLQVPWAHWIAYQDSLPESAGSLGVGVFEGGYYRSTGVFRSSVNSRMRDYSQDFGAVNTEQWILRLYTLTQGIRSLSPELESIDTVSGEALQFNVEPMFGNTVQKIVWTLNGESLELGQGGVMQGSLVNGGALQVDASDALQSINLSLPAGVHKLSLRVRDVSGRIQVPPPHAGIFTWEWSINVL